MIDQDANVEVTDFRPFDRLPDSYTIFRFQVKAVVRFDVECLVPCIHVAHDAFGRIAEGVEQTTSSVEEIATTTEEQLGTADQVDRLIRELTDSTRKDERSETPRRSAPARLKAANEG